MAILQMKRLTLAVIRDQKDELMKELIRHGCVEVSGIGEEISASEIGSLVKSESSEVQKYRQGYTTLLHGIELLDRYVPKKTKMLAPKPEVEPDTLLDETGMWGAVGFAHQIEENESNREHSEIDLTKALMNTAKNGNLVGVDIDGESYDVGLPGKYYETFLEYGRKV